MEPAAGIEPASPPYKGGAKPTQLCWHMVVKVGIEPTLPKERDPKSRVSA